MFRPRNIVSLQSNTEEISIEIDEKAIERYEIRKI